MRFLQVLALGLLGTLGYIGLGHGTAVTVPNATNFEVDARLAAQKQVPILVMFSATHCPYCEAIKAEQLRPMMISGDYDDKVIIRELHIDNFKDVISFNGEEISASALAEKYSVWVTPTIMFFDHQGNTLAPKIIGYNTPEMYGGYLDENIDLSVDMMRTKLAQR